MTARHHSRAVPRVELTKHLYQFFPHLEGKELEVNAQSIAEVIAEIEKLAPGFAFYICDEAGRLRRHVNVFIEEQMIADRFRLTDKVAPTARVYIMQALSGG